MEFFYTGPSLRKTCSSQQYLRKYSVLLLACWRVQWVSILASQPHRDFALISTLKRRGQNCCCHSNWTLLLPHWVPSFLECDKHTGKVQHGKLAQRLKRKQTRPKRGAPVLALSTADQSSAMHRGVFQSRGASGGAERAARTSPTGRQDTWYEDSPSSLHLA